MSSGPSTPSGTDSKRQRVLPVPKAAANMRTFEPDSSTVSDIIPSPNHGERNKGRQPDMIVLHYTGMPDVEGALARLCTAGTEVSAHYVVLEDGRIVQCVPEARRAWHAGVSTWAGEEKRRASQLQHARRARSSQAADPAFPVEYVGQPWDFEPKSLLAASGHGSALHPSVTALSVKKALIGSLQV